MARIGAAVLAAGAGVRMGTPKAELVVARERLLDRAVRVVTEAGCRPVWAVVRDGVAVSGARPLVNPDPARGMRSSLDLAVAAAQRAGVDALAVVLVDLPGLTARDVAAVSGAWAPGRIAVGRYAGRRGHPTVMGVATWRAALGLAGPDEGARAYLAAHLDLVDEVAVDGDPSDLDTPDDLRRWLASGRADLPDP
ncbi:MAG TPA: NTP transferase domain-containing protein [Jatrophihabitans sp.]|nr:NTP transferase domain-containing protein [Jatrophihabitans sp.]